MKTGKSKIIIGFLGFVALGLVLLLLRQSEIRIAAEAKLNDLKYKMESATNENDALLMDLKNTIHDLTAQTAELKSKHEVDLAEKTLEIQGLHGQLEEAAKKYEALVTDKNAELADLESKSKTQNDELNKIIQGKSGKISELGSELEKASVRYSALLKEKEALEAKTISADADLAKLKNDLKKIQREKERLSEEILALTKKPEIIHD